MVGDSCFFEIILYRIGVGDGERKMGAIAIIVADRIRSSGKKVKLLTGGYFEPSANGLQFLWNWDLLQTDDVAVKPNAAVYIVNSKRYMVVACNGYLSL